MSEHNKIQLYVGLEEGGCVDVGAIKLAGFTLIETNALQDLKAEREALAAQVEALRKALAALSVQAESALQEDIVCYSALKRAQREADYVLDKTPQHHLRELRAEAVISAIDAHKNNVMTFGFDSAIRVTDLIKYAEQIRKGEVK